jgi:aspartate/methionine/tyrosine aminotransferase
MDQTHASVGRSRSKMKSPYMEWAKTCASARYTLASSGVASLSMADLITLSGLKLQDLELTGPTGYGYAPLQKALAEKAGVSPDCVVAAAGTSMANHLAMAASLEPGDEVLIEWPTYELLPSTAQYLGAKINRFTRRHEVGFSVDPSAVERALTPRTRLIVLTNLHNPSSARTDEETLRSVGELARSAGARVLVDEVYLEACYSSPWRSAFHLGKEFITTGSLTKAYGLNGLRCGWILAEPDLARAMWHLNDFYGVNAANPAERLSVIAMAHMGRIGVRYQNLLDTNRPIVKSFLESRQDLESVMHPYGTVVFPRLAKGTADPFCRLLREKYETSVVPGAFFEAPEHFRLYLAAQTPILEEGLKRIGLALDEVSAKR